MLDQSDAEPVDIVAPISQQWLGLGQGVDQVAHLPFAEQHDQWPPLAIADGMRLEFRLPLVRPIRRGTAPF